MVLLCECFRWMDPCDCVIVAIDGGIDHWVPDMKPALCVSGINQGPNLSVDVMHSGTVSAAREAGLYGLPSIATSRVHMNIRTLKILLKQQHKLLRLPWLFYHL